MRGAPWFIGLVGAACALACGEPALDLRGPRGRALSLLFEPPAEAHGVPAVFRGRLTGAPDGGEPWLLRGELSDYHDRALRRGELSSVLVERAVPLRFWREAEDCLLQPLAWLEPGAAYTLAVTGYGRVQTFEVSEAQWQRTTRFFPPAGEPQHTVAVLCGAGLAELPATTLLAPGNIVAHVTPGALGAARANCLTLAAEQPPSEPVVAPPALGNALLEPAAFSPPFEATAQVAACGAGQLVAGACLEVADDRVLLTPLVDSALWLLEQPAILQLSARRFERSVLLRGLSPDTRLELVGRVISSAGSSTPLEHAIRTSSPRRHLVLSEVLANTLGPEPDSEWIELVNDSDQPAELSGVGLEDGGGRVALPAELLAPHEIVLLVSASYRPSSVDVAFAEGARRVRLASLGQRGLSNSGELLQLVGREGVLSRFPMLPAAHAGHSIARRSLEAADDDPRAFAEHGAPGASPGAPNFVE